MRTSLFTLLAMLAVAVIVAGCGGGRSNYPPPPPSDTSSGGGDSTGSMDSEVSDPVAEDESGGGEYGERKYEGFGQADLGGQLSEAEYRAAEQASKDATKAHSMYMEYMSKKQESGQIDEGLLNSAISMLDQVIPKLQELIEKYPENVMIQEALQAAIEDHRALMYEK